MTSPVAFEAVEQALADGGSAVHAAEAHGCLCGALCARRVYLPAEWLEELLADPDDPQAPAEVSGPLAELYERSGADLAGDDLHFALLLPDDQAALQERVAALSEWCQGFLYGFGASGTLPRTDLSDEVQEFLTDLAELTRVDAQSEMGETEEEAYAELVEYVRMGVQLIFAELSAARAGQPSSGSHH